MFDCEAALLKFVIRNDFTTIWHRLISQNYLWIYTIFYIRIDPLIIIHLYKIVERESLVYNKS